MADHRPPRVPTGPPPHSLDDWPANPPERPWRIAAQDRVIGGVDISVFFADLWQQCMAAHPLPADTAPMRLAIHTAALQLAQLGSAAHQRHDDMALWRAWQQLQAMRQLVTAGGPHLLDELANIRATTGDDYRRLLTEHR